MDRFFNRKNIKVMIVVYVVGGILGAIISPIVYQILHVPKEWQPGAQIVSPSMEDDLSCEIEARCGNLRATVNIQLGAAPSATPANVLPPGYLECAKDVIPDAFGAGPFRLSPCK